jgi:hypothetical protein
MFADGTSRKASQLLGKAARPMRIIGLARVCSFMADFDGAIPQPGGDPIMRPSPFCEKLTAKS